MRNQEARGGDEKARLTAVMSRPLLAEPPAKRQRAQEEGDRNADGPGWAEEDQEFQRLEAVSNVQDELNALEEEEAQQVRCVWRMDKRRAFSCSRRTRDRPCWLLMLQLVLVRLLLPISVRRWCSRLYLHSRWIPCAMTCPLVCRYMFPTVQVLLDLQDTCGKGPPAVPMATPLHQRSRVHATLNCVMVPPVACVQSFRVVGDSVSSSPLA